jgi:hypothetical protein
MQNVGTSDQCWVVKKRTELLSAMIRELAGDASISFEGDFSDLRVLTLPGALQEETSVLKRNTSWPKQDFAVVPLTATTAELVRSAIGGNVPKKLIHIQIEKAGVLRFAAYDNFGDIFFEPGLIERLVPSLVARGILATG